MLASTEETSAYQPARNLPARINRRLVQWRAAAPLRTGPPVAAISFTFDDFARSAADTGAEIIEEVGARGCFYACSSMAGTRTVCGEMYTGADLVALKGAGHEIGAHTHSHLDCAQAPLEEIIADIDAGLDALGKMGLDAPVRHFAWPYGETRHEVKRALAGRFETARGILGGLNRAGTDRMQLRAVELDASEQGVARALDAIERAARSSAWLIVFSHDVSQQPGPWGVTPAALRKVARAARDAGLRFALPGEVFNPTGEADA